MNSTIGSLPKPKWTRNWRLRASEASTRPDDRADQTEGAVVRIELGGSPLQDLRRLGQSAWLECSPPRRLSGSQLNDFIREGIAGVDFNPVDFNPVDCVEEVRYQA